METVIGATEARIHFGELMRHVTEKDQAVVVERDGRPQVVVLSVAAYERLRASAGQQGWQNALERAAAVAARIAARRGGQPLPPADEMVREARETRDDQLDGALGLG
jgi:prevent-host-death family protein